MVRVITNGLGDLGSIPGRIIPKTQKWYLMSPCLTLCIIRHGSRVKWSNPGKAVSPSPRLWCSRYRKGRLGVALDNGCQLYLLYSIYPCTYVGQSINKTCLSMYQSIHEGHSINIWNLSTFHINKQFNYRLTDRSIYEGYLIHKWNLYLYQSTNLQDPINK